MNKDVLYEKVKYRTIAEDRTVAAKAIEEMSELNEELMTATRTLLDHGTIENVKEIIDEMADVLIMLEQVTGERDALFLVYDRQKFKLERLAYRLKNGGLFKKTCTI